jgi:hypothetical protein
MLRPLLLMLLVPFGGGAIAQATVSDRAAKDAVQRIVKHSGLQPNFTVVEDPGVPTAVAYIKDKQRVIAYNAAFIARVADSSGTGRSAISVLAHEIAHHLLGHTLDPHALHPGDELACDRYSGFILAAMGASLEESVAAMEVAGDPHGTRRHPPRHARLEAIRQGWQEQQALCRGQEAQPFTLGDDLRFVVIFHGDANTYYVDRDGRVLWFNKYAEPIGFGQIADAPSKDFTYRLTWADEVYDVDARLTIWKLSDHGMLMQVGRMAAFNGP